MQKQKCRFPATGGVDCVSKTGRVGIFIAPEFLLNECTRLPSPALRATPPRAGNQYQPRSKKIPSERDFLKSAERVLFSSQCYNLHILFFSPFFIQSITNPYIQCLSTRFNTTLFAGGSQIFACTSINL